MKDKFQFMIDVSFIVIFLSMGASMLGLVIKNELLMQIGAITMSLHLILLLGYFCFYLLMDIIKEGRK